MRCPKCKNIELEELELSQSNVMIDRCPTCWGLWFDGGELEQALKMPETAISEPQEGEETALDCPRCGGQLFSLHFPHTDITVEVCENCRGMWLDDGEFPRIRAWHESLRQGELEKLGLEDVESEEYLDDFLTDLETATMPCPHCGEPTLREIVLEMTGVVLDHCTKCHGIWFDGGELEQVIEEAEKDLEIPSNAQQTERFCPRCETPLYSFNYPETEVKVDVCTGCHGMWLDSGEFKQIRQMREIVEYVSENDGDEITPPENEGTLTRFFHRVVSFLGS
ncbi:MAG: zf-TFIIB domain-containing protein [Candidatus Brocadiia bacterium]